jgi:hypothetical protein
MSKINDIIDKLELNMQVISQVPSVLKRTQEALVLLRQVRENDIDTERIDWMQKMMTPGNGYCEIYMAGLRVGSGDADAYQIESNPEIFTIAHGKTLREAIDVALTKKTTYVGHGEHFSGNRSH